MGCSIKSYNWQRDQDLLTLGVPVDLREIACRTVVWRRTWNATTFAWVDGQDDSAISDLDWIEYVPSDRGNGLTECLICCGIPENSCAWHGIRL